jgi:hypothetical protein
MPDIVVTVVNQLTREELDVDVDENTLVGTFAQDLRKEWCLPERDTKQQALKYCLVRNGVLLMGNQTLQQAGVKSQDVLTFYGEPDAAGNREEKMRDDYKQVLRRFSSHPKVKITSKGSPPHTYTVTYSHKGLIGRENGDLKFGYEHVVEITIPEGYPFVQPQVYMKTPAFHPNISPSFDAAAKGYRVCIGEDHFTDITIADVIARVGNYLQYRLIGMAKPWSGAAKDWVKSENEKVGPFDNVPF